MTTTPAAHMTNTTARRRRRPHHGWLLLLLFQAAALPTTTALAWSSGLGSRHPSLIRRGSARLRPLFLAAQTDDDTNSSPSASPSSSSNNNSSIYSQPALYDLAFGYRDFDEEVAFLRQCHQTAMANSGLPGSLPRRILEVAAGPGRHALTALQHLGDDEEDDHDSDAGITTRVDCLDRSPDMAAYAQELSVELLAVDEQEAYTYHVGDMRDFSITDDVDQPVTFETAWILLGSLQHLTTNADVRACLSRIRESLVPHGTLIVELPHPKESFALGACTRNAWAVPLEDDQGLDSGQLEILWGDEEDAFDAITQVRQFTVRMELSQTTTGALPNETPVQLSQVVPMRLFTAQEMDALATACGFTIVAMHGALEEGVSVDDEDAAYRLVCVLQKD
jgi:SAM-dependent methyltransferase